MDEIEAGGLGDVLDNSGDIIVCDDMLAGYREAISETIRNNKWRTFSNGILSRQQREAKIIVIGTSWHREDVIGGIQNDV